MPYTLYKRSSALSLLPQEAASHSIDVVITNKSATAAWKLSRPWSVISCTKLSIASSCRVHRTSQPPQTRHTGTGFVLPKHKAAQDCNTCLILVGTARLILLIPAERVGNCAAQLVFKSTPNKKNSIPQGKQFMGLERRFIITPHLKHQQTLLIIQKFVLTQLAVWCTEEFLKLFVCAPILCSRNPKQLTILELAR